MGGVTDDVLILAYLILAVVAVIGYAIVTESRHGYSALSSAQRWSPWRT